MTKTENLSPLFIKPGWDQLVKLDPLSHSEKKYLSQWTREKIPQLEEIWTEMDRVWDTLNLDNSNPLAHQNIKDFYSHPVWLLNGFFTAFDPESRQHRIAIAEKISSLGCNKIADFGGGFGELARYISLQSPQITVDIIEPFPLDLSQYLIQQMINIRFCSNLEGTYNCLVVQDVLEHLEEPIELVIQLVQATAHDGYIIFANCFKPVIKCHLPATFYLRHTFRWVVQSLGLKYCGNIEGAEHVQVFQLKQKEVDLKTFNKRVSLSKAVDPWLNNICSLLSKLKKRTLSTER